MAVSMETETEAGANLAQLGSGPGLCQPLCVREFHPLALQVYDLSGDCLQRNALPIT